MKKILICALVLVTFDVSANNLSTPCSNSLSNTQLTDKAIQVVTSPTLGASNLGNTVTSQAADCANQQTQQWLNNLLSTDRGVTEISGNFVQRHNPQWGILLVRPLMESDDRINTTFMQGSVFRQGDRTTTNIGLGYRRLIADKKVLLGANAFYDYEFPYGNQRSSVGGEVRTTIGELNVNYYQGMSGWVNSSNGMLEKSLGGYDAEFGLALPYMPNTHLRAKTFRWKNIEGMSDIFGNKYSLTGPVGAGFNIEAGRTIYNSGQTANNFFMINWVFGGDKSSRNKSFQFREIAYSLDSMEDKRFEKVRRENIIVKAQKDNNFTVQITGF